MSDDEMLRVLKGARKKLARGIYPRSAVRAIDEYIVEYTLNGVGAHDVVGASYGVLAEAVRLMRTRDNKRRQETT